VSRRKKSISKSYIDFLRTMAERAAKVFGEDAEASIVIGRKTIKTVKAKAKEKKKCSSHKY
jgi:hypothetical protein